jgi:hypothetical protein
VTGVDVVGAEIDAGAEIGLHRALRVGRHEDHAARGRRAAARGRRAESDAGGAHVVTEHVAELIGAHLADVSRAHADRRGADDGIRRRAAGDLDAGPHRRVERLGARGVDQCHRALHESVGREEGVVRARDHVDDRVADADNVEIGCCHDPALSS